MFCEFSNFDLPADVYADQIGRVDNLGDNFRTIYAVYAKTEGGVMLLVPMLCVVRPKSSILKKDGAIAQALRAQVDPRTQVDRSQLHS